MSVRGKDDNGFGIYISGIVALLPTTVSLGTIEGFAQNADCTGNITGVYPNELVTIFDGDVPPPDFRIAAQGRTNASGFFRLSMPPGRYELTILSDFVGGFVFTLHPGETIVRNAIYQPSCED